MATNRVYDNPDTLELDVSGVNGSGTGNLVMSGDPVVFGEIPGVALTDENADGIATVALKGVFELTVSGESDAGADEAVSAGDIVYWDDTPGEINADEVNGVRFGYALADVAAGAATAINVLIGY